MISIYKTHNTAGYTGFTLIELLIVISIIGLLAGVVIAIINPTRQRNRAAEVVNAEAVRKVGSAVEAFTSANGVYPATADCDSVDLCGGYLSSWPAGVTYTYVDSTHYYIKIASLLATNSSYICYKSDTGKVYKDCDSSCAVATGFTCVEGVL